MAATNKHGLSRRFPSEIKRQVRQRDGFGCVRCGSAIYTYEHVDPTFEDATTHDPDAITLLCAGCHDLVTRGILSKESVKALMRAPRCLQTGFSFGPFDVGQARPSVKVGPATLEDVPVVIRAAGDDLLRIDPPEGMGAPFRISARLSNRAGDKSIAIVDNEWRSATGNWDVEVAGRRITIRDAPGEISLVLRSDPPHSVVIERLHMYYRGVCIDATESELQFSVDGRTTFRAGAVGLEGGTVGFDLDPSGDARVGSGGGDVYIGRMVVNPRDKSQPLPSRVTARPSPSPRPAPTPRAAMPYRRPLPKVGRNAPCPCGSGLKFKRCCGC